MKLPESPRVCRAAENAMREPGNLYARQAYAFHKLAVELEAENAELLAALENCLPIMDAYRRVSGGDGDLSAMAAHAAIAKVRGL